MQHWEKVVPVGLGGDNNGRIPSPESRPCEVRKGLKKTLVVRIEDSFVPTVASNGVRWDQRRR
jgi:hypothetical protein